MTKRVHVIVRGVVQGVGYRYFVQRVSERLKLSGWVRNLYDGSVEAWAEGEEAPLHEWLGLLRRGPSAAHVETVLPVWGEPQGMKRFEVRASSRTSEPFSQS